MAISILPINPVPVSGNGRLSEPSTDGGKTRPHVNSPDPAAAVDRAAIQSAIENSKPQLLEDGRTLEVSFNDDVNRVVVKVKSADSGEVVRQIPPEDYVEFLAKFQEMIGVLFDEKA